MEPLTAEERETVQVEIDAAEDRIKSALANGDARIEVGGIMDLADARALVKAWRIALGRDE